MKRILPGLVLLSLQFTLNAQCGAPGGLYINASPESCYHANDGVATIANSQSSMHFLWFNGATTGTISNFGRPGNIFCTVYDSSFSVICNLSDSLVQPQPFAIAASVFPPDPYCGNPPGIRIRTFPIGFHFSRVTWSGSGSGSGSSFYTIAVNPGTLNVTVVNGDCPTDTQRTVVQVPSSPAHPIITRVGGPYATEPGCTVPVQFAVTNLTWEAMVSFSQFNSTVSGGSYCPDTFTQNIAPGPYRVWIVDYCTNGYANSDTLYDTIATMPYSISRTFSHASTCAPCNGAAQVTVTGGTPPFSYHWSGSPLDTPVVNTLCPGHCVVSVTDGMGCLLTQSFNLSNTSNPVALSVQNTGISCLPTPDTTRLSTGSVKPCNVEWDDGSMDSNVIAPVTHIYDSAGQYQIQVVDTFGCSYSLQTNITARHLNTYSSVLNYPSCSSPDSGSIQLFSYNGTQPYRYVWNNGDTTASDAHLAAGNFSITTTDAIGCTTTSIIELTQTNNEPGFYVSVLDGHTRCDSIGELTGIVHGGRPPFTYQWNTIPPQTALTANSLLSGSYSLSVIDSSGCVASGDAQLIISCRSYISGSVFTDLNGNCIWDNNEPVLSSANVTASRNGSIFYGRSDAYGHFMITLSDTGVYSVASYSQQGRCLSSCTEEAYTTGLGDTVFNVNIGVSGASLFDLSLHPGWTSASPGFQKEFWLLPYSYGVIPYSGTATITFDYDPNLIYQHSLSPLPQVDTVLHRLTWLINPVPSPHWDWQHCRLECFFLVSSGLSTSDSLHSSFSIFPTSGDCDTLNNFFTYIEPIRSSHDPNSKSVSPYAPLAPEDSILTYVINFQNTGTAASNFVIVKDTLSRYLNPASVVTIASSAECSLDISENGILTWIFDPYFLPDSIQDPEGSKGFVAFRVKRFNNNPTDSLIRNSASIYFDYNPPVETNVISDTIAISNCIEYHNLLNATICQGNYYFFDGADRSAAGIYLDTLPGILGCDTFLTLDLSIVNLPAPAISMNFDSLSTGSFAFYQWLKDGNIITGANDRYYIASETGRYSVIVADSLGCSDTSGAMLLIISDINNSARWGIRLYPNPASTQLYFEQTRGDLHTLLLEDMAGKLVKELYAQKAKESFDISELTAGIYTVRIIYNGQLITIQKLIKQ